MSYYEYHSKCNHCHTCSEYVRMDERDDQGDGYVPGRFILCRGCARYTYHPLIVQHPRRLHADSYAEFQAAWVHGAFQGHRLGQAFCNYFGFRKKADKDLFYTESNDRALRMINKILRDYQIFGQEEEEAAT